MTNLADNYIRDLGYLLRERAFEAKERFHAAEGSDARGFEGGRYMAYYEIISLMLSQAESFNLPPEMIALQNLDPEADLIG